MCLPDSNGTQTKNDDYCTEITTEPLFQCSQPLLVIMGGLGHTVFQLFFLQQISVHY